jgi:tetratricopeptide (TPR) repeat protein
MSGAVAQPRQDMRAAMRRRDWPEVGRIARRLTLIDPLEGEHWFWVGRSHEETREFEAALAAYDRALELPFSDSELRADTEVVRSRVEGLVAAEATRRSEAEAERERRAAAVVAASELPTTDAAIEAARRAREAGEEEIALAAAARGVELAIPGSKQRITALTVQGATLRRFDRVHEALPVLREAVALSPSPEENAPAHTALVAALRELRRYREAVPLAEAVLEASPEDSYMLWAAVALFIALWSEGGDPRARARAEAYAERAARIAPDDRQARRQLEALERLLRADGRTEEADRIRALLAVLPDAAQASEIPV